MLNANGHYQCDHSRNLIIRAVRRYYPNAVRILKNDTKSIENLLPLDNPMVERCERTFYEPVSRLSTRMILTAKYALDSESMSYKFLISSISNNKHKLISHSIPISIALNETKQLQKE
uniref:Uncharacterized protein n=1 Tax=Glossina palpalis gambiensis TaxID=67801 RepID=A0A1B0C7C0_9MUSC